jgi:hypothetical protein
MGEDNRVFLNERCFDLLSLFERMDGIHRGGLR